MQKYTLSFISLSLIKKCQSALILARWVKPRSTDRMYIKKFFGLLAPIAAKFASKRPAMQADCKKILTLLPEDAKVSETLTAYNDGQLERLHGILLSDTSDSAVDQMMKNDFPDYKALQARLFDETIEALKARFARSGFEDEKVLKLKEMLDETKCSVMKLLFLKHSEKFTPSTAGEKPTMGKIATDIFEVLKTPLKELVLGDKARVSIENLIDFEIGDLKRKEEKKAEKKRMVLEDQLRRQIEKDKKSEKLKAKAEETKRQEQLANENENDAVKVVDTGNTTPTSTQKTSKETSNEVKNTSNEESSVSNEDEVNSKSGVLFWVVIALASVAVIGGVIFFFYKRHSDLQKVEL